MLHREVSRTGSCSVLLLCLKVVMHFENKFEAGGSAIMNLEVSIHFLCSRENAKLRFKMNNCAPGEQENKGRVRGELLLIYSLSILPFTFKYAISLT